MIGILGAMDTEVRTLIAALENKKEETIATMTFARGTLSGKDVVVCKCGIGKVCAAMCAEIMALRYGVSHIINTGVAGAIDKRLHVADTVIAQTLVQWDVDTSALGDPIGYLSQLCQIEMPCDSELVNKAKALMEEKNIPHLLGTVATGDRFVAKEEEKRFLREQFHATACEMEGGAMAQAATMNGIPFLVLRAISDTADEGASMDYPTFVEKAAAVMADFVLDFVALL